MNTKRSYQCSSSHYYYCYNYYYYHSSSSSSHHRRRILNNNDNNRNNYNYRRKKHKLRILLRSINDNCISNNKSLRDDNNNTFRVGVGSYTSRCFRGRQTLNTNSINNNNDSYTGSRRRRLTKLNNGISSNNNNNNSNNKDDEFVVANFYRFERISNPDEEVEKHRAFLKVLLPFILFLLSFLQKAL